MRKFCANRIRAGNLSPNPLSGPLFSKNPPEIAPWGLLGRSFGRLGAPKGGQGGAPRAPFFAKKGSPAKKGLATRSPGTTRDAENVKFLLTLRPFAHFIVNPYKGRHFSVKSAYTCRDSRCSIVNPYKGRHFCAAQNSSPMPGREFRRGNPECPPWHGRRILGRAKVETLVGIREAAS